MPAPIVLVPGFWLGAWAWDEVFEALRVDGHDVTALTLPGLESVDADRSAIGLYDHVDAICEAVCRSVAVPASESAITIPSAPELPAALTIGA